MTKLEATLREIANEALPELTVYDVRFTSLPDEYELAEDMLVAYLSEGESAAQDVLDAYEGHVRRDNALDTYRSAQAKLPSARRQHTQSVAA